MKLHDYGVWFDVMHAESSARIFDNGLYEHYVVPYTQDAIEQVIKNSNKVTIDIAVVVYGYETSNSWYFDENKSDWSHSINDIKTFMRANSAFLLKQKYRNENRAL